MHSELFRPVDLALIAAKKRQSPRTGFVHLFYGNESAADTIPFYENVCFALALLSQRKTESVLEAHDLLHRLLSFQTVEGNFPVYLHDYPRCFGFFLGLRIAPLLLRASKELPSAPSLTLVNEELRRKINDALGRIFSFYELETIHRPWTPLWEYRLRMCKAFWANEPLPSHSLDVSKFSSSDWWEYWITEQFKGVPSCHFFHPQLQLCLGPFLFERGQTGFEPTFSQIDWICSKSLYASIADDPTQIGLSALSSVAIDPIKIGSSVKIGSSFALLSQNGHWNLFWKEEILHRLSLEVVNAQVEGESQLQIKLAPSYEQQRDDHFEVAFYIDATAELSINGVKGTVFGFGDWVEIRVKGVMKVALRFELIQGEGDFCGHIYRSNRAGQRLSTLTDSYDWKIGLRTLRRSADCVISVLIPSA